MAETKKKSKGLLAVLIVLLVILLALAALFVVGRRYAHINNAVVPKNEAYVDLRGEEIGDMSSLLQLTAPETIDLRETQLSAEDYETLCKAFPGCTVLWDVPFAGGRHAPETKSFVLSSLSAEDIAMLKYFPDLSMLDLRAADLSAEDIASLQSAVPDCRILWTVKVCEGLALENEATEVNLASAIELEALVAAAGQLGGISEIKIEYFNISKEHYDALCAAFPDAKLEYGIEIAERQVVTPDVEKLDLSGVSYEEAAKIPELLLMLPNVKEAELMDAAGNSPFTLEQVAELAKLCPELKLNYSFELFGESVNTSTTQRLEYYDTKIGDEGLETFRQVLPIMHALEYLRFDGCGTSDEAVAQLRDEFPQVKVVWKLTIGFVSIYTDTLRLWVNDGFLSKDLWKLKYCTDVRYIDFGHQLAITDLEWARYMPDLEVCIVAMTSITDISPLAECKKMEFLEIFTNDVSDLSPLAELENLEYLNIGNMPITDISPIFGLNKLKMVNCNMCQSLSQEQIDEFKALHPDTVFNYVWYVNPKGSGWNFDEDGNPTERYQLLRRQIGYDGSANPPGYLTEPIE